jgi:Flp pilus assembly protein CpaB
MKASTLFIITAAILLGLACAVGAKMLGFFTQPPPPVATPPPAPPEVNVLVANRTLFAGDLIDPSWVRVRKLTPEEIPSWEKNKDEYLPALPQAVTFRVTQKTIEVDQPILKSHLKEAVKPELLSSRLQPHMRAVNIGLPKDRCSGGLIAVGEWVDVYLTCQVEAGEDKGTTRTAPIAHKLRVIGKRNALWQIFAPLPDDKLVNFTLEANAYRAALIEFAKDKGHLSLVPVSAAELKLPDRKNGAVSTTDPAAEQTSFSIPGSTEYEDEDGRVEAIERGELNVNTADLMRIFDIHPPPPPPPPMLPPPPTTIQQFSGVSRLGDAVFKADGTPVDRKNSPPAVEAAQKAAAAAGIRFSPPAVKKECESCKKRKEAAGQK